MASTCSGKCEYTMASFGHSFLYGFIAVSIINLTSLFGILYVPLKNKSYYNVILSFMQALAAGSLFGTSLTVLIPESLNPDNFGSKESITHEFMVKMSTVFLGFMFFLVIEHSVRCISFRFGNKSSNNTHAHSHKFTQDKEDLNKEVLLDSKAENLAIEIRDIEKSKVCLINSLLDAPPIVWMIVLGDAFHNFMDGVSIGTGFTKEYSIGVFLSISVFCEELPHELGDFAVLIQSGLPLKIVICLNFLSACTAYIGLIFGVFIGDLGNAAYYVFALTAGFFIYISIASMVPELKQEIDQIYESEKTSHQPRLNCLVKKHFAIQCLGLCAGYCIISSFTLLNQFLN